MNWEKAKTLEVEIKKFDRKALEALEIERYQFSPLNGGLDKLKDLIMSCLLKLNFGIPFFHIFA